MIQKYEEGRPWGGFIRFTKSEPSTVKILTIKAGEAFSLQYHMNRNEYWFVLEGQAEVVIGDKQVTAAAGDEFFIEQKIKHRIKAVGGSVRVLEISFGDFDEADIVRLEDNYGRVS